MANSLTIQLMGGLWIGDANGNEIAISTRKARALLAYLALSPEGRRSREHLAAMFWSRSASEQARASLRQQLAALRKALEPLGEGLLQADAASITLDTDRLELDVPGLEGWSAGEVAALYQGRFLDGFSLNEQPFEEWAEQQASHYEVLATKALVTAAGDRLAQGDPETAQELAARALRIDALHEPAVRTLLQALVAEGNPAAARQHLQRYAQKLQAELGAQPAPELAQIVEHAADRPAVEAEAAARFQQRVQFCKAADGTRLAYAVAGSGPPLLAVSHWLSHLEHDWRSAMYAHVIAELSRQHRLVRYDKRGCGLSRQQVGEVSFDHWVTDLAAVADAAGLERFALFGPSQGGAIAIEYAWRYPERVSHLVLYGAFAKIELDAVTRERERALYKLIQTGWGQENPAFRQVFTSLMIPMASPAQQDNLNQLQGLATDGEMAAKIYSEIGRIDVREHAAALQVPTLVLHCDEDVRISADYGMELAALIPGASFVSLPSKNHIVMGDEAAWPLFVREMRAFLAEDPS